MEVEENIHPGPAMSADAYVVNRDSLSHNYNLSNEVLKIDFGQGAAKIPRGKVGGQKKYLPRGRVQTNMVTVGRVGRYFLYPPTLTSDIFAAS